MKWLAKSAVHNAIAPLPWSETINYALQRHVSKRLPVPPSHALKKVGWARRHLDGIERHGVRGPLGDLRFYEIGAGWDLVVPLSYWSAGVDHQTLIDVRPHVRLELVDASLRTLAANRAEVQAALGRPVRPIHAGPVRSLAELEARFGIRYLAPVDACATPFETGTIDVVTTSDTLEHIPERDLPGVLAECRRILVEDGVTSHLVDLMDHYRYVDDRITVHNFLRFGERAWRVLDSPLEHQNRLRRPAYRRLVEAAGFTVVEEEVRGPSDEDLVRLEAMRLAAPFQDLPLADVGAKSVHLVATPSPTRSEVAG